MAGEIAAMKNDQNQNLSTLGGKHKCYERITRKTHALLMRRIKTKDALLKTDAL